MVILILQCKVHMGSCFSFILFGGESHVVHYVCSMFAVLFISPVVPNYLRNLHAIFGLMGLLIDHYKTFRQFSILIDFLTFQIAKHRTREFEVNRILCIDKNPAKGFVLVWRATMEKSQSVVVIPPRLWGQTSPLWNVPILLLFATVTLGRLGD